MFRSSQAFHSFDSEQVGGNATDACAHGVEQVTELLDVRFTCGVVDCGSAFGQDGSHNDVGRTGDRSLVEQHIGACKAFGGFDFECACRVVVGKGCAEAFESEEVGVESSAAYFVASGSCDCGVSEACREWAEQQHASSQTCTAIEKVVAAQVVKVWCVGLEGHVSGGVVCHFHAHVFYQLDEVVDVEDVGYVGDTHLFGGEECGTNHL